VGQNDPPLFYYDPIAFQVFICIDEVYTKVIDTARKIKKIHHTLSCGYGAFIGFSGFCLEYVTVSSPDKRIFEWNLQRY